MYSTAVHFHWWKDHEADRQNGTDNIWTSLIVCKSETWHRRKQCFCAVPLKSSPAAIKINELSAVRSSHLFDLITKMSNDRFSSECYRFVWFMKLDFVIAKIPIIYRWKSKNFFFCMCLHTHNMYRWMYGMTLQNTTTCMNAENKLCHAIQFKFTLTFDIRRQ